MIGWLVIAIFVLLAAQLIGDLWKDINDEL